MERIDLVMTYYDDWNRQHAVVVEVKWRNMQPNHPGYSSDTWDLGQRDRAPSQLDRAHQIALSRSYALSPRLPHRLAPCKCGYPQVCPQHGCPRGCAKEDPRDPTPPWDGSHILLAEMSEARWSGG